MTCFQKKLMTLFGSIFFSVYAHAENDNASLVLARALCIKDHMPKVEEIEVSKIAHLSKVGEDRRIYISFLTSKSNFVQIIKNSRIKHGGLIEEPENTMFIRYGKDLRIRPAWFEKVKKEPDFSFKCRWKPYLKEGDTKLAFGVISIQFDSYHVKGEIYRFYGIISPSYHGLAPVIGVSQEIMVSRKDFTESNFLGLSPE